MGALTDRAAAEIARLEQASLRRTRRVLDSAQGAHVRDTAGACVNFSSNDYLGLASDARLRAAAHAAIDAYGVGAGASPLVSGNLRAHDEAEKRFAAFVGLPRALLFPSGFAANLGILATLADADAEIFSDRLNHASLIDGMRLSRARVTVYAHGDAEDLAAKVAASRAPVKIVATDAVFSMDGDIAPLPRLVETCERHDAWLVIDDAHGIGVLGPRGRGSLAHFGIASPRIVYMATLGKALGGYGAFVCGEASVVEWLMQRARAYVFSTALPPMAAAVAAAAIDVLLGDDTPVPRVHRNIERFRTACERARVALTPSPTPIQPVIVGSAERALAAAGRLRERGFLVPAIRPPTVPPDTSRLRVSLSAAHADAELEALATALAESLA
jgi:8-amino-7-oxononanoate synthase